MTVPSSCTRLKEALASVKLVGPSASTESIGAIAHRVATEPAISVSYLTGLILSPFLCCGVTLTSPHTSRLPHRSPLPLHLGPPVACPFHHQPPPVLASHRDLVGRMHSGPRRFDLKISLPASHRHLTADRATPSGPAHLGCTVSRVHAPHARAHAPAASHRALAPCLVGRPTSL
jgi:hypothetical protein